MRILVVEDESRIAADVGSALRQAGYACDFSSNGDDAWFKGDTESYDLVILDLGLPQLDGLTILKRWRKAGRTMPVLILTARGSWPERVEGIDAGADDYLPKPFQMPELIARVRGLIRRSAGHASAVLEAGPISVDTRQMRVSVDARTITLTPLEYRLVSFLVHNKGRVVAPSNSSTTFTAMKTARETNALEALVMRTRKKLGPNSIETRRGFGYLIADGER